MNLKIREADLLALKSAVCPHDTQERRKRYVDGNFLYAQGCMDRNLRYRWDLVYASGIKIGDGRGMPGDLNLYAYLNDKHIDAALRSIVPNLRNSVMDVTQEERAN